MAWKSRSLIILITLCWLSSFAQKAIDPSMSLSYSVNDESLTKVLEDLNHEYGLQFSYATQSINDITLSADVEDLSLHDALQSIFVENDIEYRIIDQTILLRLKLTEEFYKESTEFILSGQVVDKTNKEALEYVAISIPNTSIATMTDVYGKFVMEIPSTYIGDTIHFSLLGYAPQNILMRKNEEKSVVLELNPSPILIDEITLVYRQHPIELNLISHSLDLNSKQLGNLSNMQTGGDISRQIQMMAGVSAHDDVSSDIKIRGSNGDETLIILDGIPLYNSGHYYGIFSSINSSYVDDIQLYKNAFPIDYGGRTGGLVEIRSDNSIPSRLHGELDLNILASSAMLEIPLGRSSKIEFGGRTTISDLTNSSFFKFGNSVDLENASHDNHENLSRRILLNTDPTFNFHDFNAKWLFSPSINHEFQFNLYQSSDEFDNTYENSFMGRRNQIKFNFKESFSNLESWDNLGMNLVHRWRIANVDLVSSAYLSKYNNQALFDFSLLRTSDSEGDKMMGLRNSQYNEITDKSFEIKASAELNKRGNRITGGINIIQHKVDFNFEEESNSVLEGNNDAIEFSQFLSYLLPVKNQLFLDIGLRGTYYSMTSKYYVSPRASLSYLVQDNLSFKTSLSRNHQFLRELSHENRLSQNIQFWVLADDHILPVSSSTNYMFGSTFKTNFADFDLEFFHKSTSGVAEHALVKPGINEDSPPGNNKEYRIFTGNGKSFGLDLMVSKSVRNYQGLLAYTLSETTNSFESIAHGEAFHSQNHSTHQLKMINEFKLGKFDLGISFIYASGRPYTDLAKILAQTDIRDVSPQDRLAYLPDYNRIDLSAAYNFKLGPMGAKIGVSLINAMDNENVKYLQYIYSLPTNNQSGQGFINNILGSQTPLLSRTFNVNFNVKF